MNIMSELFNREKMYMKWISAYIVVHNNTEIKYLFFMILGNSQYSSFTKTVVNVKE